MMLDDVTRCTDRNCSKNKDCARFETDDKLESNNVAIRRLSYIPTCRSGETFILFKRRDS